MVRVVAPELVRAQTPVVRKYARAVREAQGVDPAIIAETLGLKVATVEMIQRKLGLRRCRNYVLKAKRVLA